MAMAQKISRSISTRISAEAFKKSMNDWIIFLDHSQRDTKTHMRELERRIRQLEAEKRTDTGSYEND
jgi:hypothetical protein